MTSGTRAFSLLLCLLGLLHTGSPFVAQAKKKPSRRPAPNLEVPTLDPQQDYKQQALELLPLLSERIDAIKSPSWKVRLKAFLAELLATHNPEGARQLFQESLQSLHAVPVRRPQDVQMSIQILNQHRDGVAAAPTPSQLSAEGMTNWELNSLSSELLARAAMADPTYAEALAENLAYTLTESDDPQRLARRKARVVGPVGLSLAQDQPELAAQWVEKNLGTGVSIWTYLTLETMRQQNPQLADATFNKALSHLESDPSGSVQWVLQLGCYLFPSIAPGLSVVVSEADEEDGQMGFDLGGMGLAGRNPPAGDPNPELVSRYLNLAYERYVTSLSALSSGRVAAENPALQGVLATLPAAAVLRPLLAKYLPDKAASLQVQLNELSKYFSNEDGTTLEKTLDFFAGMGDPEKQAQWEAEPSPENQDSRYYGQAITAINQGRTEEAVAILDKVKEEGTRANIRLALVSRRSRRPSSKVNSTAPLLKREPFLNLRTRFAFSFKSPSNARNSRSQNLLCCVSRKPSNCSTSSTSIRDCTLRWRSWKGWRGLILSAPTSQQLAWWKRSTKWARATVRRILTATART